MAEKLPLSDPALEKIRSLTATDEELQALILMIKCGRPNDKRFVPAEIRPFFHSRDKPTVELGKGIVYKGNRCVVPATMQEDVLGRLHRAHLGFESRLRRARGGVLAWNQCGCQMVQIENWNLCNSAASTKCKSKTTRSAPINISLFLSHSI